MVRTTRQFEKDELREALRLAGEKAQRESCGTRAAVPQPEDPEDHSGGGAKNALPPAVARPRPARDASRLLVEADPESGSEPGETGDTDTGTGTTEPSDLKCERIQ